MGRRDDRQVWHPTGKIGNAFRGLDFWRRATGIYLSYKAAQTRASLMRFSGQDQERIDRTVWKPLHEITGKRMYDLCVDLRGFYLKGGQFLGTRADFMPEEICNELCKLHDQVPPMPGYEVERLLKKELDVKDLSQIFEEIELDSPLGSASIAQVHKGRLRRIPNRRFHWIWSVFHPQQHQPYVVQDQEQVWDICNSLGISQDELRKANKGLDLSDLRPHEVIRIPSAIETMRGGDFRKTGSVAEMRRKAVKRAMSRRDRPIEGLVAVKIQYPDALEIMKQDLGNIRTWAKFLSKTEIQFDLVSTVDELKKQIEYEFDFTREARVMDSIAIALQPINKRVTVPRSIPGLVTKQMLIMSFIDGIPLRELSNHTSSLSPRKQRLAKERILRRLCEAYGRMIFGDGLFQADGHPGNILIQKGARIALLDYGQSKKLSAEEIHDFSLLVLAIARNDTVGINNALDRMGMEFGSDSLTLKRQLAVNMFDTKGTVNPFNEDSVLRQCSVTNFPSDFFFLLRVIQLIRGIKQGMEVDNEFSSAKLWRGYAKNAIHRTSKLLRE